MGPGPVWGAQCDPARVLSCPTRPVSGWRESSDGLWSAEPGLWVGRGPQRGVWSSLAILCIWSVVAGLEPGGRALGVVISTAMVDIAGMRRGPSVCPSVSEVLLTRHPWRCCALLCGANKVNGTKGVVS